MADTAKSRRRRNTVTRFLEDVIDDTKDLVDDVVDRAKDAEGDTRRALRRVVDDDEDRRNSTATSEMDTLKSALDDLTEKVNRLVALQGNDRTSS